MVGHGALRKNTITIKGFYDTITKWCMILTLALLKMLCCLASLKSPITKGNFV